jgi:alpha/beta superfamily hydrolase
MKVPAWIKPSIYGAITGGALVAFIGFSWGGWVTSGAADKMAVSMARDDVVAAMVPVCLDMARTDPERMAKLTTIKATETYQRRDALMEAGWATMPGTDAPDRDIAKACLAKLEL